MYIILDALVRMLAPVISFTSEEIWKHLPHRENDNPESIQLNSWPEANEAYDNQLLKEKWDHLIKVRDEVLKALENARNEKIIGSSLEASVTLKASGAELDFLSENLEILPMVFIVSDVNVEADGSVEEIEIDVKKASGEKCERCWIYSKSVGKIQNIRLYAADAPMCWIEAALWRYNGF